MRQIARRLGERVHLFAAVEPTTGASSALLSPEMNTGVMIVFLRQLVREELRWKEHAPNLGWGHGPGGLAHLQRP